MINYFWKKLNVKLTLATSIRQNDNILKNFGRKMRQNKTVAKKNKKFEKQNRFAKKKSFKFKWNRRNSSTTENLSTNRINKLFDKLSKTDVLIKSKKSNFKLFRQSAISAKNCRNESFFKFSKRFCKHYKKNYWNMNCKKKKYIKKKFKKILLNVAKNDDNSTMFDNENIRIYRIFEKIIAFDFNSKKKIESLKFDNDFMMCFDNFENDILQHKSIKSIFLNITSNTSFIKNTFLHLALATKHL